MTDKYQKQRHTGVIILICFFIALFGWCFETVGEYILYSSTDDRGFLTLPLCPIYAAGVLGVYLIMGTPREPRGVGRYLLLGSSGIKKYGIYFAVATILPTLAELVVGGIFKLVGKPLWDYSDMPFNLFGVICLYFSLLWGVLITLFMSFLWDRLYRLIGRLPVTVLFGTSFFAVILTLADFLATLAYTFL